MFSIRINSSIKKEFITLPVLSITFKIFSILSIFLGIAIEGLTLYGWGRFSAFYDTLQTIIQSIATMPSNISTNSLIQLPPLPIWPLLVLILLIFAISCFCILFFWAMSHWIDLRIQMAEEEREARQFQTKALTSIANNVNAVAKYFSSLSNPTGKS